MKPVHSATTKSGHIWLTTIQWDTDEQGNDIRNPALQGISCALVYWRDTKANDFAHFPDDSDRIDMTTESLAADYRAPIDIDIPCVRCTDSLTLNAHRIERYHPYGP